MTTTAFFNGTEISAEVFSVDIRRGRSREVDEFQSASGTVRLRNYDRNFDPPFFTTPSYLLMESGDFLLLETGDKILLEQGSQASGDYGVIEIGGTLTVLDGAVTVFTGHVEDINYTYDADGRTEVTFIVGDALTSLGGASFQSDWAPTDDQLSGARITEILGRSDVDMAASIGTIDGGTIRLQGGTITEQDESDETIKTGHVVSAGTNVLQYVQTIARTEYGKFYVDAAGDFQFRDRYTFPSASPAAEFDDTDTNFPFHDSVEVLFGSEFRAWSVTAQRVGGIAQTATSTLTPPATLGLRGTTWSGLLYRGDAYCRSLARFLVDKYASPEAIISGLRILIHGLGTSDRATIAGLDINDTVTLSWTPTGSGSTVAQTLVVEGVTYRADSTKYAAVDLQLSSYPTTNYFMWDTDLYDSGVPFGF